MLEPTDPQQHHVAALSELLALHIRINRQRSVCPALQKSTHSSRASRIRRGPSLEPNSPLEVLANSFSMREHVSAVRDQTGRNISLCPRLIARCSKISPFNTSSLHWAGSHKIPAQTSHVFRVQAITCFSIPILLKNMQTFWRLSFAICSSSGALLPSST